MGSVFINNVLEYSGELPGFPAKTWKDRKRSEHQGYKFVLKGSYKDLAR